MVYLPAETVVLVPVLVPHDSRTASILAEHGCVISIDLTGSLPRDLFFCSSVKSILFSAVSYQTSLSPTKSSFVKIIIFTYYNLFSIAIFHQKVRPLLSVYKVRTKEALLILPFWSQFRNETIIDNNRFCIGHIKSLIFLFEQ